MNTFEEGVAVGLLLVKKKGKGEDNGVKKNTYKVLYGEATLTLEYTYYPFNGHPYKVKMSDSGYSKTFMSGGVWLLKEGNHILTNMDDFIINEGTLTKTEIPTWKIDSDTGYIKGTQEKYYTKTGVLESRGEFTIEKFSEYLLGYETNLAP